MNSLTEAISALKLSEQSCREEASGKLDESHSLTDGMNAIETNLKEVRRFLARMNRPQTVPTQPIWQKVSDEAVRHLWSCDQSACSQYDEQIMVDPSSYSNSGTPICSECGEDLAYHGTEIQVAPKWAGILPKLKPKPTTQQRKTGEHRFADCGGHPRCVTCGADEDDAFVGSSECTYKA